MSLADEKTFTRDELFAAIERDGITLETNTIKKAQKNDAQSIYLIGAKYYSDDRRLYTKALAWFRLSAEKQYSVAQKQIGLMYYHGKGVSQDYLMALEWYLKTANYSTNTCFKEIGEMFEHGRGVTVNKTLAYEWYRKGNLRKYYKPLKDKGYDTVIRTEHDKIVKALQVLRNESEIILKLERTLRSSKKDMAILGNENRALHTELLMERSKIETLEKSIQQFAETLNKFENEIKHVNERLALLEKENSSLSIQLEQGQQSINKSILKEDNQKMKNKVESLEKRIHQINLDQSNDYENDLNYDSD